MTTHENIIEAIRLNGWTAEEAELIAKEYRKRKVIKIDKHLGQWNYTSGIFAEREPQEVALDIAQHPTPTE